MPGSGDVDAQQVVGPDGWTTLVWSNDQHKVMLVRIKPNGSVSAPIQVSGTTVGATGYQPAVAIDRAGKGIIVYDGLGADGYKIRARRFSGVTTRFKLATTTVALGTDSDYNQTPSVGLGSDGVATIAWRSGVTSRVNVLRLRPNNTTLKDFQTDLCKADSTTCLDPRVFTASSGVSTIIWTEQFSGDSTPRYRLNQISALGFITNGTSKELSDLSRTHSSLQVVQASGGSLFAAWTSCQPLLATQCRIDVRRISSTGIPASASEVVAAEDDILRSTTALGVSNAGAAIISWIDFSPKVIVKFRRLTTGGVKVGAGPVPVYEGGGMDRVAVSLSSNGAAQFFIGEGTTAVHEVGITGRDLPAGSKDFVAGTGAFSRTPMVTVGRDGTLAATWLTTPGGGIKPRQFVSQLHAGNPTLTSLKFPARFKSRQRTGQVKINSSKYGTAVVTIAPASRKVRFRTRVTRIAVPSGSTTLKFNTTGLVRGKYTVTVQLLDYAGLKVTKSAKLLVTS